MCSTQYFTVLPMLWWTCFDDVWTTIWWIVQIQCAVFQNEKSLNKERIPDEANWSHCIQMFVLLNVVNLSLIELLRGNWSKKSWDVATTAHPLSVGLLWQWLHPLCNGLAPTGFVVMTCWKTWERGSILSINSILHRKWRCGWEKVREERRIIQM